MTPKSPASTSRTLNQPKNGNPPPSTEHGNPRHFNRWPLPPSATQLGEIWLSTRLFPSHLDFRNFVWGVRPKFLLNIYLDPLLRCHHPILGPRVPTSSVYFSRGITPPNQNRGEKGHQSLGDLGVSLLPRNGIRRSQGLQDGLHHLIRHLRARSPSTTFFLRFVWRWSKPFWDRSLFGG